MEEKNIQKTKAEELGIDVDFKVTKDEWTEILIEDEGVVLRIKPVITKVIKTSGIDPITQLPQFIIISQNVASTSKHEKRTKTLSK